MSPEFAGDPMVSDLLEDYRPVEEFAQFKGYSEPVRFLRIAANELQEKRDLVTRDA